MKTIWKIAVKNCIVHKWMTLVLVIIFSSMTIAMFWVFGFSNYFENAIVDRNRPYVGDVMFSLSGFVSEERLNDAIQNKHTEKVCYLRVVGAMVDALKSSSFVWLKETDNDVMFRYREEIRPMIGRLPEKSDEIMVQELNYSGKFKIGDVIYLTTSTTKKVINTLKYRVIGINKSAGFFITPEAMNELLNSTHEYNQVWVLKSYSLLPQNDISSLSYQYDSQLKNKQIWAEYLNIYNMIEGSKILINFFKSVKILLIVILIPLAITVIMALVWMTALKRRKEIWTYSAMGMRDGMILRLMILEFCIIVFSSYLIGVICTALLALLVWYFKIYLVLGSLIQMPLLIRLTINDIILVLIIIIGTVIFGSIRPLNKIIKSKPFSY